MSKFPNGRFLPKPCRACSTVFTPSAPSELYCSKTCKTDGNRHAYYMRTYGIGLSHYNALMEQQGGKCAICKSDGFLMREHHRATLMVDHDHSDGSVRGLLCHNCNRALGLLQDSPDVVSAAHDYLIRHSKGATTIPQGSRPEAIAGRSAVPLVSEGDDIVWTRRRRRAAPKVERVGTSDPR